MNDEDLSRPRWKRLLLNRFVLVPATLILAAVGWNLWVVTHDHGIVEGRVLDSTGAPVEGAEVKLWVFNFATFVVKDSTTELLFEAIMSVIGGRFWLGQTLVSDLIELVRTLSQTSNSDGRPLNRRLDGSITVKRP